MTDIVPTWIDKIARAFEIDNGRGGKVRSFRVFEKTEIPESLAADMFPAAISYITGMQPDYSESGSWIIWQGETAFYLVPNVSKTNIPFILPFYGRILAAAAGAVKLGGAAGVDHWILRMEPNAVQFVTLRYGSESDYHGLLVKWEVKENVSTSLTISA